MLKKEQKKEKNKKNIFLWSEINRELKSYEIGLNYYIFAFYQNFGEFSLSLPKRLFEKKSYIWKWNLI